MELELITERLRLTPYATDDVDLAVEMWTDPEVVKYICDVMTEEEIRKEMSNSIKRGGNGGIGIWCVADRRTGEKLGDSYLLPLKTVPFTGLAATSGTHCNNYDTAALGQ